MIAGIDRRYGLLEALARCYDRLEGVEGPGWSREKFGWAVVIDAQGEPIDCIDLRDTSRRKPNATLHTVPAGVKRASGIAPNFLWDKTSYSLGCTAGRSKRTADEHEAFVQANLERLAGTSDAGLIAFRRFLERWRPDRFENDPFRPDMLDANIMFRLDTDDDVFLHQRPAARRLVDVRPLPSAKTIVCLVTGDRGPVARLHPSIKGVEGAQSAGASLVSFNLPAFESYGMTQGENAPTSEAAAFKYGAALNRMVARDSRNRVKRPIGGATVVYWADASNASSARAADAWFGDALSGDVEDEDEARKVGEDLERLARGVPLSEIRSRIEPGTRFHVLGLSPNVARLAIRYWLSDDLDTLARRLAVHHEHLRLEPVPWRRPPGVNSLLAHTTALQGKFENVPPLLAGEVMRAILTGTTYPRTWLAAAIMRLRAGDDPALGWHAAAIRAVLTRQREKVSRPRKEIGPPMSLDRDHPNIGYQLGRLFAVYELAQRAALGRSVKSTIRDKYFAGASSAPASIFPLIIAHGQNHLARVRKDKPGWAAMIEREVEEVMGRITPTVPFSLPRSLRLEDQGEFAIGYYHQRKTKLGGEVGDQPSLEDDAAEGTDNDE